MPRINKILVLAGGHSEERNVSLVSALSISKALKNNGYDFDIIDPASGNSLLDNSGEYVLDIDNDSDDKLDLKNTSTSGIVSAMNSIPSKKYDLVFNALHGGEGENGTLQAILDLAGLKYTGSGMMSSAICMNKSFSKQILKAEGITTADWLLLDIGVNDPEPSDIDKITTRFSLPLIVKPNRSGSTVGLTLVKSREDLNKAIQEASKYGNDVLIEQYIKGREITAAVLNGEVLPLVEIVPSGELYDYKCKYTKGKSEYICPAKIEDDVADKINSMVMKAYEVCNCSGLARVDFILDDKNIPYFLEVNTLPGMTELSLAPMAAKQVGIEFDRLIKIICESAVQ